ncbi:MAG: uracil phosphoribosyltransferase [candidate division KSB1 bacterium]|nr:uracil phosphoribosyltransferase [candidate division KSB1 bacterium]MDZ7340422.1 uracil phosphoribosyltransferase [candidate division KSB1 bacterium]
MRNFHLVNHPLAIDKVSRLRDKHTSTASFRQLIHELSMILAVEATSHCQLQATELETPLEKTIGKIMAHPISLIPILRAGLGMTQAFLDLMPNAQVGYLGVARNEVTLQPQAYYEKLPPQLDRSEIFLLDPMLATGGSADYGLSLIKNHGGQQITLVTIIAAPEGVALVSQHHPNVKIVSASLDRELNKHGYILPGLGDAGDRLNGTC